MHTNLAGRQWMATRRYAAARPKTAGRPLCSRRPGADAASADAEQAHSIPMLCLAISMDSCTLSVRVESCESLLWSFSTPGEFGEAHPRL